MSSLASALTRIGLAPTPDHTPAQATAPAVPAHHPDRPGDTIVRYAAGLLRLGAGDAASLAQRLDRCIDGTGAGRARWEDWVRTRLNQQPQRVARELEGLGLGQSLTRKGVPTWGMEARDVLDALRGGYAQEWLDQQQADTRAAAQDAVPELGAEEAEDAYRARVLAWADERPRGVLARLCPASWGDSPDVEGAIRQRIEARRAAQRAAEQAREEAAQAAREGAIQTLIASGASIDEIRAAIEAGGYTGSTPCYALLGESAQAWAAGGYRDGISQWRTPLGDAPPQGWAAIPLDVVLQLALPRAYTVDALPSAVAEVIRRVGDAGIVRRDLDGETIVAFVHGDAIHRFGGVYRLDCAPPVMVTHAGTAPGPAGWAEKQKDGWVWCGPDVWAALSRVQDRARTPGTLDVSRVIGAYGRHPERRYPRLSFCAWKSYLTVGVDDALGSVLDDIVLLRQRCPDRVPAEAYRLHAEVRKTQANGLQIVRRTGGERAVVIEVAGHASSQGRHGWSGSTPSPRADSPALAATVHGGSGGGGQRATVTVAVLTEGRPLLMDSGIGYRLSREGWGAEKVPGLSEGRPGTPVAV